MVEKQRYSLDGFEMRGRVRGYNPRPVQSALVRKPQPVAAQKHPQHAHVQKPAHHVLLSSAPSAPAKIVKKQKSSHVLHSAKGYSLLAAAFTMIVIGGFLTIQGFKGNQNVAIQAKALAENAVLGEDDKPANNGNYDETEPPKDMSTYKVAADMPRFLSIPDVGVMARIKRVGTDSSNTIISPKNVFDVGWYDGSSKPGESGVIFLDGHVSGPTKGGIFWNLKKIDVGDTITIENGSGQKFKFKVAAKELFEADSVDMAKVLKSYDSTKNGLNIMTCNGKFDVKTQSYDKRLVIYAVAE